MSDLEARLERALEAEAPPARDPLFRIEVLLRRERVESRRRLLRGAALALGVGVIAALAVGVVLAQVGPGTERLALISAAGVLSIAALAAPYLGLASPERWRGGIRATWRTFTGV